MEIIIASVIAFATTNIDDIFILTLFFGNPKVDSRDIVLGQYLGIGTLIAISFAGSFIGLVIDPKYIGLLGLIPMYVGIKSVLLLRREDDEEETDVTNRAVSEGNHFQKVVSVAGITIANGGDNISIYVPLFATLTLLGKLSMMVIFLLMTGLWCVLARYLSKRPVIQKAVYRYGHVITPFIFILLGIYILYESKTFDLLR